MRATFVARGVGCAVLAVAAGVVGLVAGVGRAQPPSTVPPDGLRENTPAVHALANAKVVLSPGRAIERGTIVVRDGVVVAVGASGDVAAPADARVWDLSGQVVYPGLIDAYSELGETAPATSAGGGRGSEQQELIRPATPVGGTTGGAGGTAPAGVTGGAAHWNSRVAAQVRVENVYRPDAATNRRWRGQGVVARLVAPGRQIVKGTSAAVGTGDADAARSILRPSVAMHVQLAPAGRGERVFPVSPMGAVALVRQAMYDAQWYGKARAAWEADPSLPRPERNDALEALQGVVSGGMPLMVDAPDEQYFMRADRLGREFKLNVVVRGSGQEYRRLEDVAGTGRTVIVPLNFTRPPNVASPESAMAYSLTDLMDWDLQPENPGRLERAGVRIALTGHGLRDPGTFLSAVRKAVARGLSADGALRALTTTPAELLGLSRSHGTIEVGKAASFVVADGELFSDRTKVMETWVDGARYEVTPRPKEDVRGTWTVTLGDARPVSVRLSGEPARLRGRLTTAGAGATRPATTSATARSATTQAGAGGRGRRGATTQADGVDLANLLMSGSQLAFTFKGDALRMDGVVQVSATVSGDAWIGSGVRPDGTVFSVTAKRAGGYGREEREQDLRDARRGGGSRSEAQEDDGESAVVGGGGARPVTRPVEAVASTPDRREAPVGERERPTTMVSPTPGVEGQAAATQPAPAGLARSAERASTRPALFDVNYPLGAFGRSREPEQPAAVLFKDATVWTSGPRGRLAKASVLVERGKITAVSAEGEPAPKIPEGAIVIDCAGRHLSPGIIDCHSHVATDGGINEGSQSITCEVRIADFIDPDDVNIYRQLAGGVTAANILHGSANTIGGQNQVIKMRWGASGEGMKFAEAVPGVKFALGENVKRSNFETGVVSSASRYPASRMGVEQLVRDAFSAARDYRRAWEAYRSSGRGVPPRVDLELEALSEIVDGRRIIHCHSYRQDEILALIRTCEQFGVRVAVFQHVLEGYKVADAIARHGAAGSTFSDWWAYKAEAWDAIPYNGWLMHHAGVNVSFNSDDAELARRMNLEAGKAVKYGGVPEEEALKFVTLNPAKQLRIDQFVGSIEVGKHADLVVWSGPPMSTLGRCEQTWVDGRRYFDREEDAAMRKRAREMRAALVQKILGGGERMGEGEEEGPRPRDVWKHSEDCRACDCGFVFKR